MKRIFITMAIFATGSLFAQNVTDALRLSSSNTTGTARYRAMGGAFGALGGDLSAIGDNPASSAVFTRGAASFSFALDGYENTTTYFGNTVASENTDANINQAGGVFVLQGAPNSNWQKFSLGFNYDRVANFDNQFTAQGVGNRTIGDYFLNFAQGIPLSLLETLDGESIADLYQFLGEDQGFGAQQALLGFQSFIIDPVTNDTNETEYFTNTVSDSYDQRYILASDGYNGKASFNLAAQYRQNLYIGINLNSHFSDYTQSTLLFEDNNAPAEEGFTTINNIRFENNLRTLSNGFSFQAGTIIKANENVRLGFTYDSPTWFNVQEEGNQRVTTTATDDAGTFTTDINPRVQNVFERYDIKTPAKVTGSAAYLFGKQGLISFDYSYRDMTQLRFRPITDPFFTQQNTLIEDVLQPVNSFKLGAEIRSREWSFRGGYRYEDSPFIDETTISDLTGYSAGIGYNFGNLKLDVAYDRYSQQTNQQLYSTGLTSSANVDSDIQTFVATITLGL